ncbi:hypothetical protein GGH17_000622 [Coemansia sp. RSA 788]|nr:hypothetical protein GGH17_000622 [Coemansia sp. RSA 788]
MRVFGLLVLALLCVAVRAWEKLDHEIFELYDNVKRNEVTSDWYELLGIEPKASVDDISRAYRQLSKKYHPDKLRRLTTAQNTKETKRFQRLSLVVNILRDKESRKRYNFFRKNGVPAWRGTAYLYRRWRPGFAIVVCGLFVFAACVQYLFHVLSYWRAQQRIRDIEEYDKSVGGKVKVKVGATERQTQRQMRRRMKSNGGQGTPSGSANEVDDSGVEGEDMDRFQVNTVGVINPYEVRPASIRRVFIVSLPLRIVHAVLGKSHSESNDIGEDTAEAEDNGHAQNVERAMDNLSNNEGFSDSEAKAKKASKKAAKAQARRRRVPRILVRPSTEPIGEQSTQPQVLQKAPQPQVQQKAPQPQVLQKALQPPPQKAPQPQPKPPTQRQQPLFPAADGRNTYHQVITAAGKQLGSLRRSLENLSIRSSVGILGRPTSDTRALIAQLSSTPWPSPQGVGVWITNARIALIDAPPVLSTTVAATWMPRSPRHASRVHDLQITLWMLHTCQTLLVVDRSCPPRIDERLARLLACARDLAPAIPGLSVPAAPGSRTFQCSLHVVAVYPPPELSQTEARNHIALKYEEITGIRVARVTFMNDWSFTQMPSALDTARLWAADAPLYDGLELGSVAQGPSRDECVEELRRRVLCHDPRALQNEPGAWAASCLRAWDSIRRSDHLHTIATSQPQ